MLVKVNHNTHQMTSEEQRYWMHALEGDPLIGDFLRRQGVDMRKKALNQPICERCEKLAFWHKSGVMCPSCGHEGPSKTHKLKIHLRDGYFK